MAKPNIAKTAPMPPAPPPVPEVQRGTHGPRALAPTLVEMPSTAPNPEREVAERTRAAVDKANERARKMAVEGAEVQQDKPAPKAAGGSSGSSTTTELESSTESRPESSPAEDGKPDAPDTGDADGASSGRGPRYELKAFKAWAREHPEEAAEIGKHVFQVDGDLRAEWIRIQNKSRKVRNSLAEERKAFEAEREAVQLEAKQTAETLTPIVDLFEAVNGKGGERMALGKDGKVDASKVDFDAGDQAFKQLTGISVDDYMRARARKGISISPEMRAMKLENERLKKLVGGDKEPEKEAEPEPEKPPVRAKEKPKPKHDWSGEIGSKHALRKIADWETLLDGEMRKYYDADLDEYSEDPETIADRVLKRELAALRGEDDEEEAPKPRAKPKIAARAQEEAPLPKPRQKPVAQLPDDNSDAPKGWKDRERWAMERAMRRLRGEVVE